MIFVTVGMHHQGFERLIGAMDEVARQRPERVVMQIGASAVEPRHAEFFRFADTDHVERLMAEARLVVGHAGAGTVIAAARHRRPLIVAPRRASEDEHVDDHQLELADALSGRGEVLVVDPPTPAALMEAIDRAPDEIPPRPPVSRLAAAITQVLAGGR